MREPILHHYLVVGGSGMLASLCISLANEGNTVSVLCRNKEKVDSLAKKNTSGIINPIVVDYTHAVKLSEKLEYTCKVFGCFSSTICWVHLSKAPLVPLVFGGYTIDNFYHIHSSASSTPGKDNFLSQWNRDFTTRFPYLKYQTIILGFKKINDRKSRWLTHGEISEGVDGVIKGTPQAPIIIGQVRPWSLRP